MFGKKLNCVQKHFTVTNPENSFDISNYEENKQTSGYFVFFDSFPIMYAPIIRRINPNNQKPMLYGYKSTIAVYPNDTRPKITNNIPPNKTLFLISISPTEQISFIFNNIFESFQNKNKGYYLKIKKNLHPLYSISRPIINNKQLLSTENQRLASFPHTVQNNDLQYLIINLDLQYKPLAIIGMLSNGIISCKHLISYFLYLCVISTTFSLLFHIVRYKIILKDQQIAKLILLIYPKIHLKLLKNDFQKLGLKKSILSLSIQQLLLNEEEVCFSIQDISFFHLRLIYHKFFPLYYSFLNHQICLLKKLQRLQTKEFQKLLELREIQNPSNLYVFLIILIFGRLQLIES